MKIFLTEKTRQEKIINEVQKKRNLFGLGLTSLIAACSAAENAAENGATEVGIGKRPETALTATQLTANTDAAAAITFTTEANTDRDNPRTTAPAKNNLKIVITEVEGVNAEFTTTFKNGDHQTAGSAKAAVYTTLTTGKSDLVVSSSEFGNAAGTSLTGAIYIVWNMGAATAFDGALNYLKVAGVAAVDEVTGASPSPAVPADIISSDTPEFYEIGGATDQADMVFLSTFDTVRHINILWDVTQYTDKIKNQLTVDDAEILQVQGTEAVDPEFIKVNNNDDYDMIVYGTGNTYILWDVANYHDANATTKAVVDLTDADTATATHGLLKIEGLAAVIKTATMNNGEVGYTDIDGGGTNDLAFVYGPNTYILFGEKVANIEGGKAISYTVDLGVVTGGTFYDKDAMLQDEGFFDYDFDGTDENSNPKVEKVGYRFIADPNDQTKFDTLDKIKTEYGKVASAELSEEVYWDIA